MRNVLTGRVDLLWAVKSASPELQDAMASLLGFERIIPVQEVEPELPPELPPLPLPEPQIEPKERKPVQISIAVPFWQADTFHAREPMEIVTVPVDDGSPEPIRLQPEPGLESAGLASPAALLSRLRRTTPLEDETGELDLDRIVDRLVRCELLHRLPRQRRRRWGPSLQIIVDRSVRLIPYWADQCEAVTALQRVYPHSHFQVALLGEGKTEPWICLPEEKAGPYRLPEAKTPILVLGDLGGLARDDGAAWRWWLERGQFFLENGNRPLALVPCHPDRCPHELAQIWTILPWERATGPETHALSPEETDRVIRRILALLSISQRVEPRMIRAVRRLLPESRSDAGIESLVWQDESLHGRSSDAAAFDLLSASVLRERFRHNEPALRRQVLERVGAMLRDTYEGLWYAAVLGLEDEVDPREYQRALRWSRWWRGRLAANPAFRDLAGDYPVWFRHVLRSMPARAFQGRAGATLQGIFTQVNEPDEPLPAAFDPMLLPGAGEPCTVVLAQAGNDLVARPHQPGVYPGSQLGLIRTRNRRIKVEQIDADEEELLVWPPWAVDYGTDQYGAYATLEVGGVRQKLRWIPPGRFLMGSPDDEWGRWPEEGPQHVQAIERGFWMFDTPCTQALWQAVMGENSSLFRGPDRPVDNISWEDAQNFLARIAEQVPGLRLSLPSEAQWEYTCRAGTTRARYAHDLSEIAWYRENSGGETHPVGEKQPNPWGLYDMLGNVYEWCADEFREYGSAEIDASDARVLRGGSWLDVAGEVRAASRGWIVPGRRHDDFGFRCAEFGSPGPGRRVERTASRSERRAEPSGDGEPASATGWLELAGRNEGRLAFPAVVPVRILSDLEELTIRTSTRPAWASEFGRDRYGLWAELKIAEGIFQRLRWIPPGWFLMGSPESEAGRYDDEGPQHEVTIERGFWMFATPCTQAVWEAVMESNPSEFRSPTRPVESVSWDDCQESVRRLNERLDGLELSLPSEAQWEYACRAGTTTASYGGNLEISGANNAPVLDEIAWYGGNCGVDSDLAEGYDTSGWVEKQYSFDRGGTRPVALKRPNDWGLYDMLGNVWEWCSDTYEPYGERDRGTDASAGRVLRGGSWGDLARDVRAASRCWVAPGSRIGNGGFRCAEFREGLQEGRARRAPSESERRAEPRADREVARPRANLGD
jgi:formylglycine-generating enzyme required for sulfatase activity